MDVWNNLPQALVDAPSVESFKIWLDLHWANEGFMYDFEKLYNKYKDSTRQQEFNFTLEEDVGPNPDTDSEESTQDEH